MNPKCECNRYMGCYVFGTVDMYPCLDIFVSGSLPHFYRADPIILTTLEGMNPKHHLHKVGVNFDLVSAFYLPATCKYHQRIAIVVEFPFSKVSGTPIFAYERWQVNFLVQRVPEYPIFSSIAGDLWIPAFWYEESFSILKADLVLIISSKM